MGRLTMVKRVLTVEDGELPRAGGVSRQGASRLGGRLRWLWVSPQQVNRLLLCALIWSF